MTRGAGNFSIGGNLTAWYLNDDSQDILEIAQFDLRMSDGTNMSVAEQLATIAAKTAAGAYSGSKRAVKCRRKGA